MHEKFVSTQFIYQGRAVGFRCDHVALPNGKRAVREYLTHPGAASIIPFLDSPREKPLEQCRIVMVTQYRYPIRMRTDELPAGKIDPNESVEKCLVRELKEETGYTASKYHHLISFAPTQAFSDEIIHIYWTDRLKKGKSSPDEDEFLSVKIETFGQVLAKIRSGKIKDSKTIIGLTAFAVFFKAPARKVR